jgi:riboflavin biosynthesis pyrimidine reductase
MIEAAFGLAKQESVTDIPSLARSYGPWSGVRSNHVINNRGSFTGVDGSSRSITTEDDKALMIALRSAADLVIVDAATARKERYKSPSSLANLAIFSRSGDFDQIPAVADAATKTFLFTPEPDTAPIGVNLTTVRISDDPFAGFSDWSSKVGFCSMLLEAGPTLTAMAFASGLVSESALTLVPAQKHLEPSSLNHPFDLNAKLVSIAHSLDASFTLWKH